MTRHQHRRINEMLLVAVTAPTFAKRQELLQRVVKKAGITLHSVYNRMRRMGISDLPPTNYGPSTVDLYEVRMQALIRMHQEQTKLLARLGLQVGDMRAWLDRPVGLAEAASILRVRKSEVSYFVQLGLLHTETENGQTVTMKELRRFIEVDGRPWALPKTRTRAKLRRMNGEV